MAFLIENDVKPNLSIFLPEYPWWNKSPALVEGSERGGWGFVSNAVRDWLTGLLLTNISQWEQLLRHACKKNTPWQQQHNGGATASETTTGASLFVFN